MVLVIVASGNEIGSQARITVTVHVAVHRGAHAHLTGIEVIGHVIVGVEIGQAAVQQLGTLGSCLDEAHRAGSRFLGLALCQGGVGIDHAQRQSQTQGVGELHPASHIAFIHVVIVGQQRATGLGQRGEHLDGTVEFSKKAVIYFLLAVIGCAQRAAPVMDVGDGAVHVGHTVQGLDLDNGGQSGYCWLIHLASHTGDTLPSRHHFAEGTSEHLVIPAAHEAVGAVVNAVAPSSSQGHIARERVGTQALCHLIVRRQAVARAVVKEHYPRHHLREKGAHILIIVGQFLVGEFVLVGIDIVK